MQSIVHLTPNELATLGYTDLSLVSETEDFLIYRAHTHDGQSVLIKTPSTASYPAKPDAMSIVKAQHLISAEMVQDRLGETLLHVVMENTAAQKGYLYLAPESELFAVADSKGQIEISLALPTSTAWDIDTSILYYVKQTQKGVFLENTLRDAGIFCNEKYLARTHPKSVLCQPIVFKSKLLGAIYLENNLEEGAFSAEHQAALEMLVTQAAISLKNTHRYNHLRETEAKFSALVQNIQTAIIVHDIETQTLSANKMAQELLGLSEVQLVGKTAIDPAWHFLREDGSVMPQEEYPVNRILTSHNVLQNYVLGIDRPDREEPIWTLVNGIPMFDEADSIQQVIVNFTNITEWKKAQHQLVTNEQLFRTLVENSPDHIARYDLNLNRIYLNPAIQKLFQVPLDHVLSKTAKASSPLIDPERYMANLQKVIDTGRECSDEISFRTPQGELRWASSRFAPELDIEGKVESVLVISNDITEQKHAESKRLEYMRLLESLDRINRVFQSEGDMEKTMNRALEEVLDILDCDRAYLMYPCDPDAESWSVPLESTRAEYPGASQQGPQPMDKSMSSVMQALLETNHPLQIGPGGQYPITEIASHQFNTRSVLAMILRPSADKPWQFGLQQCSHERIWNDREMRLFEEIGHRLSAGLNSLLITRTLRESEARFRLVFENSPVSIQEEDHSAVKMYLETLRSEFGDDLETYLEQNPAVLKKCASLVRIVDINRAAQSLHEADSKEAMQHGLSKIFLPESMKDFQAVLVSLMRGETKIRQKSVLQTLTGRRYHIDAFISVCAGYEHDLGRVLISLFDITELKQAEQERQRHLHFLESLDRINRAIQSAVNLEQMMTDVLNVVLEVFACDRAYLQYPCDPDASEWWIPMESCNPDYPSKLAPGQRVPMDDHIAHTLRGLLETNGPLRVGPGTNHPIPPETTAQLGVRSLMAVALRPKADRPWQFGVHQCSHDRIWTVAEERLLQEIGRRLSDGLNSLLITRNLRESEERFRLVYENSPIPIWEEDFSAVKSRLDELKKSYGDDLETYLMAHLEVVKECAAMVRIVNVNSAALELHEADSKETLYAGLPRTFITESYNAFRQELIALSRGETELVFDSAVQTLSGRRREVSVSFSVCPGYEQSLKKIIVSLFDITQRKQNEDSLRLAASVFSTSQEGILISDADNRIIDINPAFSRLTGYSREEALGKDPGFLSAGRQDQAFYAEMWQSINATGEWQGEIWNQRKSGEVYPELLSIVAVRDEQGQLQHFVGAFSDISMIKQHEEDLDRIAHYDMLTSVPNRRLLRDRLEQAIAHTRRHGRNLAVCYLDLDGFKPINDQYGHEGGDRMLIEIARRLESMSRGEDTVSRLGGDEFVLLWSDIDSEAHCVRALERILDKVSEPMLLKDEPVSVSASIGVTLFPDDDVDADSLLRHADHAMYTAKQLGKNRYQIFDARLERQISAQAELLAMVARGLDRNQFELYYQPKVDYPTGKVIGVEALLRWNDPILGLVSPKEFLSLIENDGLAFRMGRWVMEEAVRQAERWDKQGINLPISINIFPRHLKSRTFINDLRNAIEMYWPQMPKNRLLMEIIETSDLEELAPIEEVIKECLTMGVGFSLDDFGTGYSSLVYLRQLSIEELKIDQSFVRDMLEDPNDEAIVVGVISLGRAFGLRVVAEGVESGHQAQYLVDLGCNIVQGYGLGRPMPLHAFQKWYTDYLANELKPCHE